MTARVVAKSSLAQNRNVGSGIVQVPCTAHPHRHLPKSRMAITTQKSDGPKRRYPRIRLPKGMLVAWQYGGSRGVSRVATMGLGGLFITTPQPAPVGTLLRLIFDLPGGEVRARATVRDIKDGEGMAVGFIAMGHGDRARLDQMIKKLLD